MHKGHTLLLPCTAMHYTISKRHRLFLVPPLGYDKADPCQGFRRIVHAQAIGLQPLSSHTRASSAGWWEDTVTVTAPPPSPSKPHLPRSTLVLL